MQWPAEKTLLEMYAFVLLVFGDCLAAKPAARTATTAASPGTRTILRHMEVASFGCQRFSKTYAVTT